MNFANTVTTYAKIRTLTAFHMCVIRN